MLNAAQPLWESTSVQNLFRYRPSGTYFAWFKVGGKPIRQSLGTTMFSVRKIRASVSLKPRSKAYREMMIDFIRRSWPSLMGTDVRKVSDRDCEIWLNRYQQHYSPTVVNNSIGTLRAVFEEAISTGARFNNPAAALARVKVRQKRLKLPSREEFLRFVDEIRTAGAGQSKDCAHLVRFLAYSGVRIGEAKYVRWADANLKRRELHVRGDPITATKNGETRFVPMIPELEQMISALRTERADEPPTATVMRVFECQNSSTNAAAKIGMKRITHHDLRHLFATICIESGVDIPTFHGGSVIKTAEGYA